MKLGAGDRVHRHLLPVCGHRRLEVKMQAQLLHHPARGVVVDVPDADDRVESAGLEAEAKCLPGGLGGEALPPVPPGQAPADLDRGQHFGQERRHGQRNPADELAGVTPVHGEHPVAVLIPLADRPRDALGRLLEGAHPPVADVFHHLGVGVDLRQRYDIPGQRAAQREARGLNLFHLRRLWAGPAAEVTG
jgi:hypothetical protein